MSRSQLVAEHLPLLRRYSRALTGNQTAGDAYVGAILEALLQDQSLLDERFGPRPVQPGGPELIVGGLTDGAYARAARYADGFDIGKHSLDAIVTLEEDEIAQARGVPEGVDCISPSSHSAFTTPLEMMAFIEQLGVRNLIVEANEAHNFAELQKVRKSSQGLSFQDLRMIRANVEGITDSTPRKRFVPSKLIPSTMSTPTTSNPARW